MAKSRSHFVRPTLDLLEKPLDDILRANGLPMLTREAIEGQAGFQIPLQTSTGAGIDPLVLLKKSRSLLIGCLPILLLEDGSPF
jgi:hypothetical protein